MSAVICCEVTLNTYALTPTFVSYIEYVVHTFVSVTLVRIHSKVSIYAVCYGLFFGPGAEMVILELISPY